MSTWTVDEVAELEYGRGGGNEYARETYFANLDEHSDEWPSKGDKLEVFKKFIDKAYNRLYWNDGAVSKPKKSKHKKSKEKKKKNKHPKASSDQWDFTGEPSVQEDFDLFGPMTTGPETTKRAVIEKPFENNTFQAGSPNDAEFDLFGGDDTFQASSPNFDPNIPTALSGDDEPSDQFGEFTSFTSNGNDVSKEDNSFDVFAQGGNTSTHNSAEDVFASFGGLGMSSGPEEERSHKKKKSKKKKKSLESSIAETRDDDLLNFGQLEDPAASSDFMASIMDQSSTTNFSTTNRGAPSSQSTPDAFDPFSMLSGSLASSQAAPPININKGQSHTNPPQPPSFNYGMGATTMQSSMAGLGGFGQSPFTGAPSREFLGGRSTHPVAPSTGNNLPVGNTPSLQKKQAPSSHHGDPFAGLVNF